MLWGRVETSLVVEPSCSLETGAATRSRIVPAAMAAMTA